MTQSASLRTLLCAMLVPLSAIAGDEAQTKALTLIIGQLNTIEALAQQAEFATSLSAQPRYLFDYEQLAYDLERVRLGVHEYLIPSRAQPNQLTELSGVYRHSAVSWSEAHEHD